MLRQSDYRGFYFFSERPITYTFSVGGVSDNFSELDQSYQDRFRSALDAWSSQSDLTFEEVLDPYAAQVLISWALTSNGSDGDGRGGNIVYTQMFTTDDDLIVGNSALEGVHILLDRSDIDYFDRASLIGIGQILGIEIITHTSSVMNTFEKNHTSLTDYDVSIIQSLYGAPGSGNTGEWKGTAAAESMAGAPNSDIFYGAGGDDTIFGYGGDDLVYGNQGEDLLFGSSGNDTLYGGQNGGVPSGTPSALRDGHDLINGGIGDDLVYGNHGGDYLSGGSGNDTIYGGQDSDTIEGGPGNDVLFGNLGSDIFSAGYYLSNFGQDTIYGFELGVDFIYKTNDTVPSYGYVDDAFLVDFGRYGSFLLVGVNPEDPNTIYL